MRRALLILVFIAFFPLAFLPGDVSGSSPCSSSNSLTPPFISSGVRPNILIVLDNSNSMDEDFLGNAVGSYSQASKSVAARQALQQIVSELQTKANVGLMTFTLPGDVKSYNVHNALPFASYDPASYCSPADPNVLQACVDYCTNPSNTAAQTLCENGENGQPGCGVGFTTHTYVHDDGTSSNFPDKIITYYAAGDPTRARYCGLAYPKTNRMVNPTDTTHYVYWNQADPYYSTSNDGTQFGYCGKDLAGYAHTYNAAENASNTYEYFYTKTGTSNVGQGYSNYHKYYTFTPTDSDWALGFYNWGQMMPWYYVGPAWESSSSVAGPTPPSVSGTFQGYLNLTVGPLVNSCLNSSGVSNGQTCSSISDCKTVPYTASCSNQFSNVLSILNPNIDNSVPIPSNTPYMQCNASNKNTCSYIVNAGNTPTAGTLYSALEYFNNQYTVPGAKSASTSPISSTCQKNYIVFVTDGLPATMLNGSVPTTTTQYCYNSSGASNNQTCKTTSDCPSAYSANCSTAVMSEVLTQLSSLQKGVSNLCDKNGKNCTTFPIKTYVLGVGLTTEAQGQLDQMAAAGGTAQSNGHAYYANDPTQLYDGLESIITDILGRVASGTSISILSEGQTQNGDNILQGVFYPTKYFGKTQISWPGYLYNYWFYNAMTKNCTLINNVREDTVHDYILTLEQDYGLAFMFDYQNGLSVNRFSDPAGTGDPSTYVDTVGLDSLSPLWEAGKQLFQQTADSRQILIPGSNANGSGLVNFNTSNAALTTPASSPLGTPSTFDSCLEGANDSATLQNLISYVRGTDIVTNHCSNGSSFNSQLCTQNSDCASQTGGYTSCLPDACRNRTAGMCSNGTSFNNIPCTSKSDCAGSSYPTCTQDVWKLGDIVYSSPKVHTDYFYCSIPNSTSFNSTACSTDSDCTSGSYSGKGSCQKKESFVFVGANDGMLHAFKTGILAGQTTGSIQGDHYIETFTGSIPNGDMGKEAWAFIPQNSLPYLRCLASPPPNSCHLYYNDLSPYISPMNVTTATLDSQGNQITKTTLRWILIGGMRLGGGSVQASSPGSYCFSSSSASNGQACSKDSDCKTAPYNSSCSPAYPTNVPADTCNGGVVACTNPSTCSNPSSCTGLSSYYAIDITDAENPKLLWEFSNPFLGYTYSGPAVIHKWSNPSTMSGDQYYVMFLSGPTDPSDGSSIQDVQAFVLTLNANLGINGVYHEDFGQPAKNGFAGRLFTTGLDVDGDGYTDFVFFGYGASPNGKTGSWQGGIGKIFTGNTDPALALNPQNWNWDVQTYSNIAQLPITAQVATGNCFNTNYLFTGTGRYFFPLDNYGSSGNSGMNYIMGIPFTCDQNNTKASCGSPGINSLNKNTNACSALQSGKANNTLAGSGWLINLDTASADGAYLQERMITDPVPPYPTFDCSGNTIQNNVAYFVTSEPTSDPCGYGGQSRVWGVNCATGAAITDTSCNGYVSYQPGGLYLQTSTGAINKIDNTTSFTGKTSEWFAGMPPENAPGHIPPPPNPNATLNRRGGQLLQWIER